MRDDGRVPGVRVCVCTRMCMRVHTYSGGRWAEEGGPIGDHVPSLDLNSFSIDLHLALQVLWHMLESLGRRGTGFLGSLCPPVRSSGGWRSVSRKVGHYKTTSFSFGSSQGHEKCSTSPGCN